MTKHVTLRPGRNTYRFFTIPFIPSRHFDLGPSISFQDIAEPGREVEKAAPDAGFDGEVSGLGSPIGFLTAYR